MGEGLDRQSATPTALDIALQWAQLPPDHLQIALQALEPQLAREHEGRMTELKQTHQLYMTGLCAGIAIALGMLSAAVVLGLNGRQWLAGLFAGPSVIALVTLFVLRRVDANQTKAIANVASQSSTVPSSGL